METTPTKKQISSYIIQTQEEEIKRIALELHEGVGQTLYSFYTGLQFIETSVNSSEAKAYLGEMNQILEKTIQEIRMLSVELHPPTLTTLGLLPAMKSYLDLYTSTYGIIINFETRGDAILIEDNQNITLFRVCQEALANIAKYADTLKVDLTIVWEDSLLTIEIKDFGNGFDTEKEKKTTGLAAMNERMNLIGGKCVINSKLGEGTTINIFLPL